MACFSYEIDPGLSTSFHHTWEDGSHAPTLNVTESGTYAVTIADDCVFGIDSIEVTILGNSIVELGPAEIDLCEGENYEISLDPNLGDYLWQDGSTNSTYTITEAGIEIFTPSGQPVGIIPVSCSASGARCQGLAFGGADKRMLYVAGQGTLLKIQMLAQGFGGRAK